MNNELPILPMDKSVVFYSPLESNDILVRTGTLLVRTGTLVESECFLTALIHVCIEDYTSLTVSDRLLFIANFRDCIRKEVEKELVQINPVLIHTAFQQNVTLILSEFYRYIGTLNTTTLSQSTKNVIKKVIKTGKKDIQTFKLITELLPISKGFKNHGITTSITDCKREVVNHSVEYCLKELDRLEQFETHLEKKYVTYYINKVKSMVTAINEESESKVYDDYFSAFHHTPTNLDSYIVNLVSDKIDRDIYFIDSLTRMPYIDKNHSNIRKRKSIVILTTQDSHYETVGKLLSGNRIQRDFNFKDPLIKRMYTFLCNPSEIPVNYPSLVPFLLKKYKNTILESSDENLSIENSDCCLTTSDSDDEPKRKSQIKSLNL